MATIQDEIFNEFLNELQENQNVDTALAEALRVLFDSEDPVKVDDLVDTYVETKESE